METFRSVVSNLQCNFSSIKCLSSEISDMVQGLALNLVVYVTVSGCISENSTDKEQFS
jgi:hypothetical protein